MSGTRLFTIEPFGRHPTCLYLEGEFITELTSAEAKALAEVLAWGQGWPTARECAGHVAFGGKLIEFDAADEGWVPFHPGGPNYWRNCAPKGPLYGVRLVPETQEKPATDSADTPIEGEHQ